MGLRNTYYFTSILSQPIAAYETNYVEFEAIYSLIGITESQRGAAWSRHYDLNNENMDKYDLTPYEEVNRRATKEYKK